MDCEYSPTAAARRPPAELVTGRGRKKRRGRLAELLRRQKPRFDPAGAQPLAQYVDQYYRLDEQANPHPFKYRQVAANDFGLDTEEVRRSGADRDAQLCRASSDISPAGDARKIVVLKQMHESDFIGSVISVLSVQFGISVVVSVVCFADRF